MKKINKTGSYAGINSEHPQVGSSGIGVKAGGAGRPTNSTSPKKRLKKHK